MTKSDNITQKIATSAISISLVVCLIFSSLTVYFSSVFFNDNFDETSISAQEHVYHTNSTKSDFLAEIIDLEEEEDEILHKKKVESFNTVLRTLWSYSFIEAENQSVIDYAEVPVVKISEPCYIEYCSLKIPS